MTTDVGNSKGNEISKPLSGANAFGPGRKTLANASVNYDNELSY